MSEQDFMKGWLASESAEQDKITVKRIYIDINEGNLYDGVLFSQIMYWHGNDAHGKPRLRIEKEGHLWLAKTYEDWWAECRIESAAARKCIERIVGRGLLIKKVFKFDSVPTVHLRVNFGNFQKHISICYQVSNGNATTYQMDVLPGSISLTETTPETTTETTVVDNATTTTTTDRHSENPETVIPQTNAYALFAENIGTLTPFMADTLKDDIATYSAGWVEDAIREGVKSARNGKPSWKYIQAILARWKKDGKPGGRGKNHQNLGGWSASASLQTTAEITSGTPSSASSSADAFKTMLLETAAIAAAKEAEKVAALEHAKAVRDEQFAAEREAREAEKAAEKHSKAAAERAMIAQMDAEKQGYDTAELERVQLETLRAMAAQGDWYATEKLRLMGIEA